MQRDRRYSREKFRARTALPFPSTDVSRESEHLPMQIFSYGRNMRGDALSVLDNPYFAFK